MKPLGLLYLTGILRERGHFVRLIDSMDRKFPDLAQMKEGSYGRGEFYSLYLEKPAPLRNIPRNYKLYGLPPDQLEELLIEENQNYDYIILTSGMTYWYQGLKETSQLLKKIYPDTPIILGGIYATLLPDHASKNISFDYLVRGGFKGLEKLIGIKIPSFSNWPAPDYSDYEEPGYAVVRSSRGCKNSCPFCGIKMIFPGFDFKEAVFLREKIRVFKDTRSIENIVFYDDDLLASPGFKDYLKDPVLGVKIHTPNGLDPEKLDPETGELFRRAGVIDPCVSADILSAAGEKSMQKHSQDLIERSISSLRSAGYRPGEYSTYIIGGLPNQDMNLLEHDVRFLHETGARVRIAEYSPVPGTSTASVLPKELMEEPLLHNNSLYPALKKADIIRFQNIKKIASTLNGRFNQK
ncbi:MAG: radical SAM protein [Elusimicrobia bacterium]|nr:radical SAM protein [Elusimicrobiota bacterium]